MPGHTLKIALITALALGAFALTRWTKLPSPTPPSVFVSRWKPIIPSSLSEDFRRRLGAQDIEDIIHATTAPDLNQTSFMWPGHEDLLINAVIHRGHESALFRIEDSETVLVKFQADCDEIGHSINPLLNDYWFGKEAAAAGIGPDVFFLSAPSPMSDTLITKYFTMSPELRQDCVRQGGSVRYMVLALIPDAIDLRFVRERYPVHMLPFAKGMELGIKLIEEIRRLHLTARIVHGDIHPGNMLLDNRGNIKIIDYGRARFNQRELTNKPVQKYGRWYHQGFSPWQIEGYEWSMRDDIYNAIRSIALMINGDQYYRYEETLARNWTLMNWKKFEFIFSLPISELNRHNPWLVFDPISSLKVSESRKAEIREALERVLDSVRSLRDINQVPYYDNIIRDLALCRTLAS